MPLINEIAGRYPGNILVVGGGMRAPSDFEEVKHLQFSAILAANDHAFKIPGIKPDFIVCKDHCHTQTKEKMERLLRKYGVPIITRHFWADHRLPDWSIQGNSGLMAIAVAGILGATTIYPIGFDFFQEGTHFHEPDARNVSRRKHPSDMSHKAKRIRDWLGGISVRPVSGPLLRIFDGSSSSEVGQVASYGREPGVQVKARQATGLPFSPSARILPGTRLWVSKNELKHHGFRQDVDIL